MGFETEDSFAMKRKRRREDKRNRKDGRKTNKKLWGMRVTASNGDGTSNGDHGWGLDCTGMIQRFYTCLALP
ncbi:Uncharacterized protein HZ326_3243 [Fusarium oxysporum f. sp. albedinis]|jgi:hypothetical protein|nr:Uncharacterized protein HZ326_3243 [Fusarium oxysporum f. sp. albedinis]RKK37703.1 hypothetical protein BFJ66_g12838 [Fusarium oxysporum f. sp. cepae]